MAKKAVVEEKAETTETVDEPPKTLGPFTISKWHDMDNYECTRCSFSTVEGELVLLRHFEDHLAITRSSILGPDGRPLEV